MAWYRKLIAKKFDGSMYRKSCGRPRIDEETERWVVRMAKENPTWGYDRIVGAMGASAINCWWDQGKDSGNSGLQPNFASTIQLFLRIASNCCEQKVLRTNHQQ